MQKKSIEQIFEILHLKFLVNFLNFKFGLKSLEQIQLNSCRDFWSQVLNTW